MQINFDQAITCPVNRRHLLRFAATLPAWPDTARGKASGAAIQSVDMLSVKHFGAVGDGKVDDYTALSAAISSALAAKKDLHWPSGIYRTTATLVKPQSFDCCNFLAESGAVLDGSGIADGPTLKIKGGSGRLSQARIEGFDFIAGTGKNSTGLEIADQCGIDIVSCSFSAGTWGLTFHNESGFTEYAQANACAFSSTLRAGAVRYWVTDGTESFNGSGLHRCRINLDGGGSPTHAVVIEQGALLYHAPMDFQVWVKGQNKIIVKTASSLAHLTHGTITIEVIDTPSYSTAPELFGGSGAVGCHQGDVMTFGTAWLGPKIKLSGSFNKRIGPEGRAYNGSTATTRHKFGIVKTLDPGETVLRRIADMGSCIAHVHLSGPDYDYRYLITAGVGISGGVGVASIISILSQFNASGAGSADFAVNPAGDLTVTNAKFDKRYTAFVVFLDLGPSMFNVGPSLADYKPL